MKRLILTFLIAVNLTGALAQVPPDMEIITRALQFTLAPEGMTRYDTVLLQINNRNADTEIQIPYSRGDKVNIGNVWIEDTAGNIIRSTKRNDIKDRSSISSMAMYEDNFEKYFDLKHNVFPYRIYYTTRIQYARSLNIIEIDHSWSKIAIRDAKVIVEVPFQDSIWTQYRNIGEPDIAVLKRYKRYTWQYCYKPPLSWENNNVKSDLKAPCIKVAPLHFKYGEKGSFASWQSFGNWVFRLNQNRDKLTSQECRKIDNMLQNIEDDSEKAKILYRYLQDNTRYINVSIELGGLQTHPASYVCEHKYGDCKALTNYMQSMLKYAGIPSFYTLIDASPRVPEIDINFPSQVFNHAILTLPLNNDTVFLECTAKNIPFGYVGTNIQGRKALLVDKEKSRLIKTPSLQPEEVYCTRKITVNPSASEILLQETQRGYNFELYTYLENEVSGNEVAGIIRNYIFPGKAELQDYVFISNDREEAEISLKASFNAPNIEREYGDNLILPPFPISITNYEAPKARNTGVQIDYPEFHSDTIIYYIPGNKIFTLPDKVTEESSFGTYNQRFELLEENQLVCYKTLLLYAGQYTLEQYNDFYRFISLARANENKHIHINRR